MKENCVYGFLIPTARLKLCQAVYLSMIEYWLRTFLPAKTFLQQYLKL